MPRKTFELRPGARGRGGFNEAAARCRGKPATPILGQSLTRRLQ